jgi:hypothetical protein
MDSCVYKCSGPADSEKTKKIATTYTPDVAESNIYSIAKRIRELYREQPVYKRETLIRSINVRRSYPLEHVFQALSRFLQNGSEWLVDRYGRQGRLSNRGEYYSFQPMEIGDEGASTFERSHPVDYKRERIVFERNSGAKSNDRRRKSNTDASEAAFGTSEAAFGSSEAAFGTSEAAFGTSEAAFGTSEAAFGSSEADTRESDTSEFGTRESDYGGTPEKNPIDVYQQRID